MLVTIKKYLSMYGDGSYIECDFIEMAMDLDLEPQELKKELEALKQGKKLNFTLFEGDIIEIVTI